MSSTIGPGDIFSPDYLRFEYAAIRPTNQTELRDHVEFCYGFRFPDTAVCPGHVSPMQILWEMWSAQAPNMLVIGSRDSGKTLLFSIAEHSSARFFGDDFTHAGGIAVQSDRCWDHFQRHCRQPWFADDVRGDVLQSETRFKNGAKGEIFPATPKQLNGPHPQIAAFDEIELIESWETLQEGFAMPHRKGNRPPRLWLTSSMKYAFGTMVKLLDEKVQRGFLERRFCVFEVIEKCPVERHQNGVGCGTCPLAMKGCLDVGRTANGTEFVLPGPGRAARANGWKAIDDVIQLMKTVDDDYWQAQLLSRRPSIRGLVYPEFDDVVHVIDAEWNPNLPVVAGIDFGYVNPNVALYANVYPDDELVWFAEDYRSMRTTPDFANDIRGKPWFSRTAWRAADHDAGDCAILADHGVGTEPAIKDIDDGISTMRWALRPPGRAPLMYFSRTLVHTLREIRFYHHPKERPNRNPDERPEKSDDHAMDAMRYCGRRHFRSRIVV